MSFLNECEKDHDCSFLGFVRFFFEKNRFVEGYSQHFHKNFGLKKAVFRAEISSLSAL